MYDEDAEPGPNDHHHYAYQQGSPQQYRPRRWLVVAGWVNVLTGWAFGFAVPFLWAAHGLVPAVVTLLAAFAWTAVGITLMGRGRS